MPLIALLLCWCVLVLPPMRRVVESTMATHMLVQIPALVLVGGGFASALLTRWPQALHKLKPFRWALLVSAGSTLAIWMIPRLLDLAVERPAVDLAKALTLSLAGGLPLHLAWRNIGPVVRGLIHVEALASLWRLGWVYLESPARLCARYGLADQYRLGHMLLAIGACYALWLAWHALRGAPQNIEQTPR
jgi:hypothetical protein